MTTTLRRLLPAVAALITVALAGTAQGSSAGSDGLLAQSVRYNPAFGPAPAAQASGGGGKSQPGERWDGTAPPPDLALTGNADIREFQVLSGYANDTLTATISWDAGPALSYDLDLYVDRLDATGTWVRVGSSADGQLLGDGEAIETASVKFPSPGRYRTRVVNFASTETAYSGSIGFTSVKRKKQASGRATVDRPDIVSGSKLHVMYVIPADGVDEALDTNGVLDAAVASMNLWLENETPGRRLRVDTFTAGGTTRPDITFVRGNQTAAEYAESPDGAFTAITDELEARGWNDDPASKRYLVYYAGPAEDEGICGTAYLNLLGVDYAQWSLVFLDSAPGCGARDFGTPAAGPGASEAIALQEMLHNEAVVPVGAPHWCYAFQYHLCTAAAGAVLDTLDPESVDVMFPFVTGPLRDKSLDNGREDYYDHPFPYRDLADSVFWES